MNVRDLYNSRVLNNHLLQYNTPPLKTPCVPIKSKGVTP